MDRDAVVLGVDDSLVKTSTVRGAVVVDRVIPLGLLAEISVDDFGIVDLVHGDELVSEALLKFLELACVKAHGLEVDTLYGHGVIVLSVVGGAAIVVSAQGCTEGGGREGRERERKRGGRGRRGRRTRSMTTITKMMSV